MVDSVMSQRAPFAYNVIHPLRQLVHEAESPIRSDHEQCTFEVRQRYQTEIDLQQHAVELLHRDQADFVFLHLAIPHSPNLWSRVHNDYTDRCGSSYIDNLALTDRVLGQFLAMLKASPRWSQTTLIVQGDHSWRTAIWNGLPAWTDEDDAASRDAFDPRPALLIHQPTQTQPQTVDAPWSILKVHSVVEQTLHSQPPAP
jgi:membrane-anchored protein YejM (alkaline phosphatase superfamily)